MAPIDLDKTAEDLQADGAKQFEESWGKLLQAFEKKGQRLKGAA